MGGAYLLGSIAGGVLIIYLMSVLLEWAFFKRIVDIPELGKALSVAFAVIAAVIIAGFGNADGGPWNPGSSLYGYVIGGAIVLALRLWAYRRRAERSEEGLAQTFE